MNPSPVPVVPSARQRLVRSLLSWGLGALGAWGLHAAIAVIHPVGADFFWPGPDFGSATTVVVPVTCCVSPLVIGLVPLYLLLGQADLRRPLWTAPLFVCCFVANFLCPGGNGFGQAWNSMLATVTAALLAIVEAGARRSRRDVGTAGLMLLIAVAEIAWLWALKYGSGV
jgi:hypothetical protein